MKEDWGMYARRNQMPGDYHSMLPILSMIDDLEDGELLNDEFFPGVEGFFDSLTYTEQTLGLSWLTKITYTLPEEGEVGEDVYGIPGLNIIDLNIHQEIDEILEAVNERT